MSRDECKRKAKFSGSRARQTRTRSNDDGRTNIGIDENAEQPKGEGLAGSKPRVFVGAENGLLREALSRMSVKGGNIEVAGGYKAGPFRTEDLLKEEADILQQSLCSLCVTRPAAPRPSRG